MAIEAVNANTGVFPSPPLAYLPSEPVAQAPLEPPFVTSPTAAPPEAPAAATAPPEQAPPPPVESDRGANIDTTA